MNMLQGKVAAVFAASGAIARAVAQSLAQHGAIVYVSGRNPENVKALAEHIKDQGGAAIACKVDALQEADIEHFLEKITVEQGKLDIVFNGIGIPANEYGSNIPSTELSFTQFKRGFEAHCGSQFLTSRAAARQMIKSRSAGTILTLSSALSRGKFPNTAAMAVACTAVEGLTRTLAAEYGVHGIRVICLNATALPETERIQESFRKYAKAAGVTPEIIAARIAQQNILQTSITVEQVAQTAAFLVSDHGITFNSHIVDVDGGKFNII